MGILIKFNAYYLLKKPSMKIEIIDKSMVRIRWNTCSNAYFNGCSLFFEKPFSPILHAKATHAFKAFLFHY